MPQTTIDHLDHMFGALDAAIKQDQDGDPAGRMIALTVSNITRILVKDIHRIADANERVVAVYEANAEAYRKALNK